MVPRRQATTKAFALRLARLCVAMAAVVLSGVYAATPASAITGGQIAGKVQTPSLAPIGGATVKVINAYYGNQIGATTTAPDGTYSIPNLAPTSYRVQVIPTGTYAVLWNNGAPTFGTAPSLTVNANATTTADFVLPIAGTVSGRITAGQNGRGGVVAVLLLPSTPIEAVAIATSSGSIYNPSVDGAYTVGGLPPGSYKIAFIDPAILNAATAPASLRPVMHSNLDILTMGLASAFASGATVTVASSSSTVVNASLRGMDCTMSPGVNLAGANLAGKNLEGCDLSYSNLPGANLAGANLNATDLYYANLTNTDLTNASIVISHLTRANFSYARLNATVLYGSVAQYAMFVGANLTGANVSSVVSATPHSPTPPGPTTRLRPAPFSGGLRVSTGYTAGAVSA